MVTKKIGKNVIFSQNHTEINSDDWTITKKTTRTIKHENFSKMKILKVDRWALSLTHIATFMWPIWGPSGSCRPQVGPLCWPHQPCYQGYYVWSNPRHRDCCRCYRTVPCYWDRPNTLQWRHNERKGFSNHWRLDCLLNRLFRLRSNKTLKLCVTCLCEGNSPVTGEFPARSASNAENVSISWHHHEYFHIISRYLSLIHVSVFL